MGIFSRFRDIISSNVNAMLEKAENPEKLIKLMIQEMEDTLVELKASCAGTMATRTRVSRALAEAKTRCEGWEAKAQLAIQKGREDLAREALMEKRNYRDNVDALEVEAKELSNVVDRYQKDIQQLEEKLETTRNKHQVLIQRHQQAQKRTQAQRQIRNADTSDAFIRFEQFENRIDRMEANADLIRLPKKPTLEDEFKALETDESIEKELESLKAKVKGKTETSSAKANS